MRPLNFGAPKKGQYLKRGPNLSHREFYCFPGGDTPISWAQTKFEAKPV